MSHGEEKAKRWRPWQFSLRTLLSLMLLVATFFGGWKANDWYRERERPSQVQLEPFGELVPGANAVVGETLYSSANH